MISIAEKLTAAIDAAIGQGITLKPDQFGVAVGADGKYYAPNGCCCAVGCFLLDKSATVDIVQDASLMLGISVTDVWDIVTGFDQAIMYDNIELMKVGGELRKKYVHC